MEPRPASTLQIAGADGDVTEGVYYPDKSTVNSLTLLSCDTVAGEVHGTFDITFDADWTDGFDYPKVAHFYQGQFYMKYK